MQDLSNLKVGDEVIVSSRWNDGAIEKVDKITPSGLIKIGKSYYYKNGSERSSDIWNSSRIRPCEESDKVEIKQRSICNKAIKTIHDTKSISYENALKILSVLGE